MHETLTENSTIKLKSLFQRECECIETEKNKIPVKVQKESEEPFVSERGKE